MNFPSRGVKKDLKKALYWYKRAADTDDPDGMANYASISVENKFKHEYNQSLIFLQKCIKHDSDECRTVTAMFVAYESPKRVLKAVKNSKSKF